MPSTLRIALACLAVASAAACSKDAAPGSDGGHLGGEAGVGDRRPDVGQDANPDGISYQCDPVAQDCAADEVCGLHCDSSGIHFSCVAGLTGSKGQGQACSSNTDCQKGTVCLTPKGLAQACYSYCDGKSPACPSGTQCVETTTSLGCVGQVQTGTVYYCYPK